MNIYLVPYTWARHLTIALHLAGAGLVTWWILLASRVWLQPLLSVAWTPRTEGLALFSFSTAVMAAGALVVETSLRRSPWLHRLGQPAVAGLAAWLLAAIGFLMLEAMIPFLVSKSMQSVIGDPSLTTFRYKWLEWAWCGLISGMVPGVIRVALTRRYAQLFDHLAGGLGAGLFAGAIWHALGYYGIPWMGIPPSLYYATAFALFGWGFMVGLLCWGIPKELYAGWVRVLSAPRGGHRIPIDRIHGGVGERFIGSFTRGLDIYLPVDQGVAELHVSIFGDGNQSYSARGLSQQPTLIKRTLERVDLRYDPRRPAPLETELYQEDRILLGEGSRITELEFVLLPKEEV